MSDRNNYVFKIDGAVTPADMKSIKDDVFQMGINHEYIYCTVLTFNGFRLGFASKNLRAWDVCFAIEIGGEIYNPISIYDNI